MAAVAFANPARPGEQDPKQSIARAEVRTPDRAPENRQLLTQRHVLEGDGSVSTREQPERSNKTTSAASVRHYPVVESL
jgi:hypothetical protein